MIRDALPPLKEDYKIEDMKLFGSFVHGKQKSDSDLDILVTFKVNPGLIRFIHRENHLSELLGVKVDLVMESALKPHIGENILAGAVPV